MKIIKTLSTISHTYPIKYVTIEIIYVSIHHLLYEAIQDISCKDDLLLFKKKQTTNESQILYFILNCTKQI